MDEEIAKTGASMGIGKLIDKYSSGILVRSPNKTHWVPRTSAAGQAIIGNSLKLEIAAIQCHACLDCIQPSANKLWQYRELRCLAVAAHTPPTPRLRLL